MTNLKTKQDNNQETTTIKPRYLFAIDFASKLGWALYENLNEEWKLINVGVFEFQDKDFKKKFKKQKFQDSTFQKIIYYKQQALKLINQMFGDTKIVRKLKQNDCVKFVFEFSDFGYKYAIESVTRLFTITLSTLDEYQKDLNKFQMGLTFVIDKFNAAKWRGVYKNSHPNINWKDYEVLVRKKKKINWKAYAVHWLKNAINQAGLTIDVNWMNNNDLAEAALIGWTYVKYMIK